MEQTSCSSAPPADITEIESVKSGEPSVHQDQQQTGISSLKLVYVVENLILIGLVSIEKWDLVLSKLKTHPDIMSNPELLNLYFSLHQIYVFFSSKIMETSDLSQHKVPLINANEYSLKELLHIVNPVLRKKPLKDKLFTYDCINKLLNIVRRILNKNDDGNDSDTEQGKTNYNKKSKVLNKRKRSSKKKPNKKVKRNSECCNDSDSSASSSTSSSSSSSNSSLSSSPNSDTDRFDSLFKKNTSKKPIAIKQLFQSQRNDTINKLTTPGENGRYMVKIEVTDVKDLKDCESSKTYWTKVAKKIVFLLDSNDSTLKTVEDVIYEKGKQISKVKGVVKETVKINTKRTGNVFSKF